MKRENRYLVIKHRDAAKYLNSTELRLLYDFGNKVEDGRSRDGKPPVESVVVESDWPEYEQTWDAIAARVDSQTT
jgi:hypothetical protein